MALGKIMLKEGTYLKFVKSWAHYKETSKEQLCFKKISQQVSNKICKYISTYIKCHHQCSSTQEINQQHELQLVFRGCDQIGVSTTFHPVLNKKVQQNVTCTTRSLRRKNPT